MKTYVSLLRGINVGGKNLIKMDKLKECYSKLKLYDIQTYLQSGNVVFNTESADEKDLEDSIERQIKVDVKLDVPVMVRSSAYIVEVAEQNPWLNHLNMDKAYMHATFLENTVSGDDIEKLRQKKSKGEEIAIGNRTVYLYCPNGYGKTKLTNNFMETNLKMRATTRNWKTVTELLKMTCHAL